MNTTQKYKKATNNNNKSRIMKETVLLPQPLGYNEFKLVGNLHLQNIIFSRKVDYFFKKKKKRKKVW